jgi:folate-dependent phosphoribosylglycinamide formyltransferase PurN
MLSDLRPLRVAFLCSRRIPGIEHVVEHLRRDTLFTPLCCITTEEDFADRRSVEEHGVSCIAHPIRRFYRDRGASIRNLRVREEYDQVTADYLEGFAPDLVVLSGYRYIVTEPLLSRYPNRILNLHEGDLTQIDDDGQRKYAGLHAVSNAIFGGERETRSTVLIVTEKIDQGALLLRSEPFPVAPLVVDAIKWNALETVRAYAFAHREWMVRSVSGKMLARAIELMASHSIRVVHGVAWIDGVAGPLSLPETGQPTPELPPCHYLRDRARATLRTPRKGPDEIEH